MRSSLARPLLPLLLLLVVGAPARADETTWVVRLGDREVGTEVVTRAAGEGGELGVTSRIEANLTGTPLTAKQTVRVGPDGALRSYRLESGFQAIGARLAEDGAVELEATVAGQETRKRLEPPRSPLVVLDNLVFAHYDLLGREAVRRDADGFELTMLVPQALIALPARFERGAALTAVVDGAERPARRGVLHAANLRVHLVFDAATGQALEVRVPAQGLEARVRGYEPPAPAGPPAGAPATTGRETEVRFPAPLGELPGVLTLPPRGEGPFPAVVLVHGSGPHDRDETIGPNRPFRDLAHGLAARGIASLRYDKRTYLARTPEGRKTLRALERTFTLRHETIDDAVAGVAFLRARPEVRPDAVFVVGHSLGALAAPTIGAEAEGARGLVLLAGPGRPFEDLLAEQLAFQAGLQGLSLEEAAAKAEEQVAPLRRLRAGEELEWVDLLGSRIHGGYWADLLGHDPVAEVRASRLPVLLLQGEADIQVRPADYEALRAALAAREGPPHRARLFPGLNHLFMPSGGPSTGAEYAEPGHVAPEVIAAIADWVWETAGRE